RYNRNNARPRLANKRSKLSNNPPSDVSEYDYLKEKTSLFRMIHHLILYQNDTATQELEDRVNAYESHRLTSSPVSRNDRADLKWLVCIYKHGSN
ncbi:unnamed protein product, partial [Schistosoma curassoni]|uniref:DUF4485 domain-containing protein n=1 Tax=Schistosoma curassoni TaxID=6186 RepID=A0A183JSP8_9TREM